MKLEDLSRMARAAQPPSGARQVALTRSYFASYRACVGHFAGREHLDESDALVAATMAYGWLPRVVRIEGAALPAAVDALRAARAGQLTRDVIESYAALVEGSVVAASKALHFVAPAVVPIYDTRVHASFFGGRMPTKQRRAERFIDYADALRRLVAHGDFERSVGAPLAATFAAWSADGGVGLSFTGLTSLRVAELALFYSRAPS